jgi:hypothetical protein
MKTIFFFPSAATALVEAIENPSRHAKAMMDRCFIALLLAKQVNRA